MNLEEEKTGKDEFDELINRGKAIEVELKLNGEKDSKTGVTASPKHKIAVQRMIDSGLIHEKTFNLRNHENRVEYDQYKNNPKNRDKIKLTTQEVVTFFSSPKKEKSSPAPTLPTVLAKLGEWIKGLN